VRNWATCALVNQVLKENAGKTSSTQFNCYDAGVLPLYVCNVTCGILYAEDIVCCYGIFTCRGVYNIERREGVSLGSIT